MSIEKIDKAYGSAYHRKNFPHLYQDNYFGSEADIANRKEQGTYVPSEMYYTDEEKEDRIGGKYFSGLINAISSGFLIGGTQPKDYELQRGGDTETQLDDVYVDKYTGNVSYRQQVPKLGKYGIEIPGEYEYIDRAYRDESGQQVTIDPELKAYTEERTDKTGSNPIANALGIILLPYDIVGVGSLIRAGGTKLVGLVKNLLPNKTTNEISQVLKNTLTDDVVTQIQNASDKETQLNILQNKLIETDLPNKAAIEARQLKAKQNNQILIDMHNTGATNEEIVEATKLSLATVKSKKAQFGLTGEQTNIKTLADTLVDLNKSFEENLIEITAQLKGKTIKGQPQYPIGDSKSSLDKIRQAITKKFVENKQLSVNDYKKFLDDMVKNEGRIEKPEGFYAGLPEGTVNIHQSIPNYNQALTEIQKRYGSEFVRRQQQNHRYFTMSPSEHAEFLVNKKNKIYLNEARPNRTEQLDRYSVPLSAFETNLDNQINIFRKSEASKKIKESTVIQEEILNNPEIMQNLSYKVSGETGAVIPGSPSKTATALKNNEFSRIDKKSNLRTFYQQEHIMPIEFANRQGVNALRNLQTLPRQINNSFKKPADRFISKLLKKPQEQITDAEKASLQNLIKYAKLIGVTLYIDDPIKLGLKKKYVGAPYTELGTSVGDIPYALQTDNIIDTYTPGINFKYPVLDLLQKGNADGGVPKNRTKFFNGTPEPIKIEDDDNYNAAQELYARQLVSALERENNKKYLTE